MFYKANIKFVKNKVKTIERDQYIQKWYQDIQMSEKSCLY